MIKKIKTFILDHPALFQLILVIIGGLVFGVISVIGNLLSGNFDSIVFFLEITFSSLLTFIMAGGILVYPVVLLIYELVGVIVAASKNPEIKRDSYSIRNKAGIIYDFWALFLAVFFEWTYLEAFDEIYFLKNYYEQLYNLQRHAPIYTGSFPTIIVLLVMYIIAMVILRASDVNKRPPLLTVISLAALYIGTILVIFFTMQIFSIGNSDVNRNFIDICLLFLPVGMLLILMKIMFSEIREYTIDPDRMSKINASGFLGMCNQILMDSKKWPIIAFILMWPLLGIVVAVLILFGQAPDSVIKAFTETADYTFSTKIPPQNLYMDEHYLCTVAAGGHEKIVKPLRMGKRHGHAVVVNRQLCIANAFEQILEEKTPKLHRVVRDFYDKYGFPVAKLIKSKLAADIVWFIMKPLEWIFLAVIYLTDTHPEDRISKQYL